MTRLAYGSASKGQKRVAVVSAQGKRFVSSDRGSDLSADVRSPRIESNHRDDQKTENRLLSREG